MEDERMSKLLEEVVRTACVLERRSTQNKRAKSRHRRATERLEKAIQEAKGARQEMEEYIYGLRVQIPD